MIVVDTNVLVYAANRDSSLHDACSTWLETRRRGIDPWYLTWSIVYEFARVVTHPRVLRKPWTAVKAWAFVDALLASRGCGLLLHTARHAEVACWVFEETPELRGNLLHDAHTAVLMREHGIRQICTRDTDFRRFEFVEILDPAMAQ